MFDTPPPHINVKTRGAIKRELLKQATANDATSTKTCPEGTPKKLIEHVDYKGGSVPGLCTGASRAPSSTSKNNVSQKSSLSARKKQLELAAAEAKAKIEKELIDKRLAAEIAVLEEKSSRKSLCSEKSESEKKVEQWLNSSYKELHVSCRGEPPATLAPLPPLPAAAITPRDLGVPSSQLDLAQAIQNLAVATQSSNTHFLSRLATPKDLPLFSGEALEWLQFKKVYQESTKLCKYSETENMARLSKCLRGEAREAVSSLLITDTSTSTIMDALELRFGRPDLIIYRISSQLKKLQPLPQNYHTEFNYHAIKITNYVAAARAINQTDYLRSPELLNTVLSKCPSALINKWADYIYDHQDDTKSKLQLLSEFLHSEATKIAAAGISHVNTQSEIRSYKKVEERKFQSHTVLNNDSDNIVKCKFCRTAVHSLTSCAKFKRALRRDRWRFVKINKICHKCLLSGHGKDTCPAALCDIENCGLAHHRMLHWPTKESQHLDGGATTSSIESRHPINNGAPQSPTASANSEPSESTSETVTNTIMSPNNTAMLKIVRVNLHGPSGVIPTHALLDDGATVSLVSADLANCINLQGQPETLAIRGAWNSNIVCQSERVNFLISNIDGVCYEMRARKINELDLPVQNLSKVNIEKYEHLCEIKDLLTCVDAKPKLLIGQDNFHLIMTLKTVYRGVNEPCATLTPLGWCLHGIVPAPAFANRSLTTELTLTTTLNERAMPAAAHCAAQLDSNTCADADTESTPQWISDAPKVNQDKELHELVRRSFAIDSIGVNLKPRANKDEVRAIDIVDKSAKLEDGNWSVGLPWKNNDLMPDTYPNAYKRLLSVERKMSLDENYASRYKDRINHLLENNYARLLTDDELLTRKNREWYLAHFGVDNPNKKKLRLVFDARSTSAGRCLNDYLLQGPDLLQPLLGIMLRFREKPGGNRR